MLPLSFLLVIFPVAFWVAAHSAAELHSLSSPGGSAGFEPPDPCMAVSPPCLSESDRYSLEALRSIHQMMDDDQDGGIEVEESVEFIIEDMKQQQTHKHSQLHREDQHITVEELWKGWKSSEVHNWTQEDVVRWLKDFVELPQYERNFKEFKVNGNTLPRIAANEPLFLSFHLKVQDQRDKQKLNIKALDVVLFGPPTRPPHNYMKDLLLIVSVVMGVGGCWFAQAQNKASKIHISKMTKDLESLQRAEQSLIDLQEQLERAQEEKRNVAEEKQNLEEKMRDEIMGAQEEAHRLHELRQGAVSELSRLRYAEEELEQVRGALKQAEHDMLASWSVSEALQQWLQLTHEVEVQYYNVKKQSAEQQLATAKDEAERIKKKRGTVLGSLHVAHSSSLDQVDRKILEAKNALSEVTACLRERLHRWQQIELLCGFTVIRNPGIANLTAQLYSDSIGLGLPRVLQSACSCHSSIHGSIENLIDDPVSPILPQIPVSVSPIKCSPRPHGSTVCRARRPGMISHPPTALISPDPDLLIPIRPTYPLYNEGEEILLKTLKKQDSQEKLLDFDCTAPATFGKKFQCSPAEPSPRKFYQDEAELLADISTVKPLREEVESAVEPPVHNVFAEELGATADLEGSSWKMPKSKGLESALGTTSMKISTEEPVVNPNPSRMIFRDRSEATRDAEFLPRKIDKDTSRDLMDVPSQLVYRERCNLPADVRRMLVEAPTSAPRMLSRDMMGVSVDSIPKKMLRDQSEPLFESRRITRDLMGMSQDAGSWKLTRSKGEILPESSLRLLPKDKLRNIPRDELEYDDTSSIKMSSRDVLESPTDVQELASELSWKLTRSKGEFLPESSLRLLPKDKLAETVGPPLRNIPRDELDYDDTSSIKMSPRNVLESIADVQESASEPITIIGVLKDEHDSPTETLRKRTPRVPVDDANITADVAIGNVARDNVDVARATPKQLLWKEEPVAFESSSLPCGTGQPDLMLTSQVPWRSSSDLYTAGPLSQLVYDGILEKSCSSTASNPMVTSASTPNLHESRLNAEGESPVPLPKATNTPLEPSPEEDKNKEKEKSKKSLKLKNLFKKKSDPPPEKIQSGLQKL
ncbi:stromal interaction molecule 2 [Oryzias melastigma]|uniref:Stromal interaction molecule 2-like n=1 Tax=Oryzias melastigma TaxID=30732 RepID=A0A3B3C515_ORYME|nr:stromal interaction molecule 2 [Oryzias melastigma]